MAAGVNAEVRECADVAPGAVGEDLSLSEVRREKMIDYIGSRTALLAIAFGESLLSASAVARTRGTFDVRTAKELAVLSRVLEKRLGEMRSSMAEISRNGLGTPAAKV